MRERALHDGAPNPPDGQDELVEGRIGPPAEGDLAGVFGQTISHPLHEKGQVPPPETSV